MKATRRQGRAPADSGTAQKHVVDGGKRVPGGHIPEGDSDPKDINRKGELGTEVPGTTIEVAVAARAAAGGTCVPTGKEMRQCGE